MIAVVADDITGAAEIAGIAYGYGLKVVMTRRLQSVLPVADLLVVITNTRSATNCEAVRVSMEIGERLADAGVRSIFKKCDSVLRGHVADELHALLVSAGKNAALLLPANPSMERKIIAGRYYVNGKPITQTGFAHDPEFPAKSDDVIEILGDGRVVSALDAAPFAEDEICIGNVSSVDELSLYCRMITDDVLPAGGGDLFRAFLEHNGYKKAAVQCFRGFSPRRFLMICGSTMRHEELINRIVANGMALADMPRCVYNGSEDAGSWLGELCNVYSCNENLTVRINQPVSSNPAYAVRLKDVMSGVAESIIERYEVDNLVVEGGATAFEVIKRLGWHSFEVVSQLSPGVICLRPQEMSGILFTIKPGSYKWPERLIASV